MTAPKPALRGSPRLFGAEFWYAAVAMAMSVFTPVSGPVGAVVFLLSTVLITAVRPAACLHAFKSNPLILAVPSICLFSVLWSVFPGSTLYYGAQFLLTVVVGVYIASLKQNSACELGVCLALVGYMVSSAVLGGSVAVGNSGAQALSGLAGAKNYQGDTTALALICLSYLALCAFTRRKLVYMPLILAAAALGFYALIGARSAGAIISGVLGVGCVFAFHVFGRLSPLAKGLIAAWLVGAGGVLLVVREQLFNALLSEFNKDPTLTGRTYIWFRAQFSEALRPFLGTGYSAFWVQGSPEAEALWAYGGIAARGGFNFHNTVTEVIVTLGYVGLAVMAGLFVVLVWRSVSNYIRLPSAENCFWMAILTYEATRLSLESIGMWPTSYTTVLIYAALSNTPALGARTARQRQVTGYSAAAVRATAVQA